MQSGEAELLSISEMSRRSGVSESRLRYYDRKKLLCPRRTESNYRIYEPEDLERLRSILMLREVGYSVREIRSLLNDPAFCLADAVSAKCDDLGSAAEKKRSLTGFAKTVRLTGLLPQSLGLLDSGNPETDVRKTEELWNIEHAAEEYKEVISSITPEAMNDTDALFDRFAQLRGMPPDSAETQQAAECFYRFFCAHLIPLPKPVLLAVAKVYGTDGFAARQLDRMHGAGTASCFSEALRIYCDRLTDDDREAKE